MKIGLALPSIFASETLYPKRIFAPKDLFVDLANGLVGKGIKVIVFAPSDIGTKTRIVSPSSNYFLDSVDYYKLRNEEKSKREIMVSEFKKRNFELDCLSLGFSYLQKGEVDLLHIYHDSFLFIPHYLERLVNRPVVYSLHDPLPVKNSLEYFELQKFKDHNYISLSHAMQKGDLNLNFIKNIYHGIRLEKFSFIQKSEQYMLFIGRLVPEKGADDAIKVSQRTGKKLKLAFNLDQDNGHYYDLQIKPYLGHNGVEHLGMLKSPRREEVMGRAKCLLFPIKWEEPFGMVMIEAMACGTPVIAYSRGSVPEIIKDGVTGFVVNESYEHKRGDYIIKKTGVDGLIEAAEKIYKMPQDQYLQLRKNCRRLVEEKFTVEKMVENYQKVYKSLYS